jgi:hypothetical protein
MFRRLALPSLTPLLEAYQSQKRWIVTSLPHCRSPDKCLWCVITFCTTHTPQTHVDHALHKVNNQRLRTVYVTHFIVTTIIQSHFKTPVFILYHSRRSYFAHSFHFIRLFFYFPFVLCLIPYLRFWTWMYSNYNVFTKAIYNQTSSWLIDG